MTTIARRTGTEGPRHDPYSFTEWTVKRPNGVVVTYHEGLGEWTQAKWPSPTDDPEENQHAMDRIQGEGARDLFTRYAGVNPGQAEKAYFELRMRRVRYHKHGAKYLQDVAGYPGETLTMCGKCGEIFDTHFNRSEIE